MKSLGQFEQHVLFCTAAGFDDEYTEQLESSDREIMTSIALEMAENFPDIDSVLFITEDNCASLVSAHHMAELLEEDYNRRVKYILLGADVWVDASKAMEGIRMKSPFEQQLWIVVGSPNWASLAASAMIPEKEEIPYISHSTSSVICAYTYRKEELAQLHGGLSVSNTTTGLN